MFCFASGSDVQIRVIAQDARGLHRIRLIVLRELLDRVVSFLVDQVALLDPAFQATGGAHAGKMLFVIDHFHALAVFHRAHAVISRSHLIAQRSLWRGNISHFEHAASATVACGKRDEGSGGQQGRENDAT